MLRLEEVEQQGKLVNSSKKTSNIGFEGGGRIVFAILNGANILN